MECAAAFPRDIASLPGLFEFVDGFMDRTSLGEAFRYPLSFTLEELFTNMVKYNPAGGGEIQVRLSLCESEVRVVLVDPDAPPFNITADAPAVDVDSPLGERSPGGLGLHLVKRMMDRVEYEHSGKTGTIRLFKRVG